MESKDNPKIYLNYYVITSDKTLSQFPYSVNFKNYRLEVVGYVHL